MLVRFLRDVIIMVAALTAIIALVIRPAKDADPGLAKPSLDTGVRIPPAVVGTDQLAGEPARASAGPVK